MKIILFNIKNQRSPFTLIKENKNATWDEILKEIHSTAKLENGVISIDYDSVRKKYK